MARDESLESVLDLLFEVCGAAPETPLYYEPQTGREIIRFWSDEDLQYFIGWHEEEQQPVSCYGKACIYARAYYLLGYLLIEVEDWPNAYDALSQAKLYDPHYCYYDMELCHVLIMNGAIDEAYELVKPNLQFSPYHPPHLMARVFRTLGYIAIEEGELNFARECYEDSLEYDPDSDLARQQIDYIVTRIN